jgi:WD40 repeat protein
MFILPNGMMITGTQDSTIRIWDLQNNLLVNTYSFTDVFNCMVWNPVQSNIVVALHNSIRIYDITSNNFTDFSATTGTNTDYYFLAMLPSGTGVIAGSFNVEVWHLTGNVSKVLSYYPAYGGSFVVSILVLPDNITAVAGYSNGVMSLFNINTLAIGAQYQIANMVNMMQMTPDNLNVICNSWGAQMVIWSWRTMNLTQMASYWTINKVSAGIVVGAFTGCKIFFII